MKSVSRKHDELCGSFWCILFDQRYVVVSCCFFGYVYGQFYQLPCSADGQFSMAKFNEQQGAVQRWRRWTIVLNLFGGSIQGQQMITTLVGTGKLDTCLYYIYEYTLIYTYILINICLYIHISYILVHTDIFLFILIHTYIILYILISTFIIYT